MKNVHHIVLTGGPCSGKTSTIEYLKKYYADLGFKVVVLTECASEIINMGFKPFGETKIPVIDFQRLVLDMQLYKEALIRKSIEKMDGNIIVIYDRGIMDNKAYLNEYDFNQIIGEVGLNIWDIMPRYDQVIHLKSSAFMESRYQLENNKARFENNTEARIIDNNTREAWTNHPHWVLIDNYKEFSDKIQTIIEIINGEVMYNAIKDQEKRAILKL